MPDVGGRHPAQLLVIQSVQNAASNERRDAEIALERAQMMGYSEVDLSVENFSSKPKNKTLRMSRHGLFHRSDRSVLRKDGVRTTEACAFPSSQEL